MRFTVEKRGGKNRDLDIGAIVWRLTSSEKAQKKQQFERNDDNNDEERPIRA